MSNNRLICEWRNCKSWLPICNTILLNDYKIMVIADSSHAGNSILRFKQVFNYEKLYEYFLLKEKLCCIVKYDEKNIFGTKKTVIFHEAFIKGISSDKNMLEFEIAYPFVDFIE